MEQPRGMSEREQLDEGVRISNLSDNALAIEIEAAQRFGDQRKLMRLMNEHKERERFTKREIWIPTGKLSGSAWLRRRRWTECQFQVCH